MIGHKTGQATGQVTGQMTAQVTGDITEQTRRHMHMFFSSTLRTQNTKTDFKPAGYTSCNGFVHCV